MSTAIAGLIGVAVGGLLTGGIQAIGAWFDRRLAARTCARLIYMQLQDAQQAVEDLRQRRAWEAMNTDWRAYGVAWDQHSMSIARALMATQSLTIASAFQCIAGLARAETKDRADAPEGQTLFDPSDELLAGCLQQIKSAKYVALRASYLWVERLKADGERAVDQARAEASQPP
jgi:hypothetical protein